MGTPGQDEHTKGSEPVMSQASGNGSTLVAVQEPQPRKTARRSTGPRSVAGKKKSRHNALKHGIFSKAALLKNELRQEFESLWNGLRDDLQPEGMLEEILVDKLATLVWRYRRLISAEAAEIHTGTAFLEWDEEQRHQKEAQETIDSDVLSVGGEVVGLMNRIENPHILTGCLNLLEELKNHIETSGLDSESDKEILTKLYGNWDHWTKTLFDTYQVWSDTADCSEKERKQHGYASIEQCRRTVLAELRREIGRLNQYKKARASIESERTRLESLRRNVPECPQLDRLLRYEANLDRVFDRTLTQLERLQRMRLGQPVSPPVKVSLSSS